MPLISDRRLRTEILAWLAALSVSCGAPALRSECTGLVEWECRDLLVARGEQLLSQGKAREALEAFRAADRLDLFEVPNYEALHRIAEARCLLGEREEGLRLLDDFRCMTAVDRGGLPCYLGRETRSAPGTPNPALSELCFLRMCSELYLSYYENLTEEQLAGIAELEREAARVRRICETMEGDDS